MNVGVGGWESHPCMQRTGRYEGQMCVPLANVRSVTDTEY